MTELSLRTLLIVLLGYPLWASATNLSLDAPEQALSQQLTQMESTAESVAARRWLEQLVDYQEQTRQSHPEHPALDLPRYALATRAQTLLQRWDEQRAYQSMQTNPVRQSKTTLQGAQLRARVRWISQASAEQIDEFRSSMATETLPEAILLSLATRQNKHADDLALAKQGQSRSALDHLRQRLLQASTTAEQSQALLDSMSKNPAYKGSVASFKAAWLQQNPKQLQSFLQSVQAHRPSPATLTTLLQLRPAKLTQTLSDALYQTDTASIAAWGLWQLQTVESQKILSAYVASPAANPQLAQELGRWLR